METQTMNNPATTGESITIKRCYNTTPEALYDALLDPVSISKWFGPNDEMSVEAEVDAVVGGKYMIAMTHHNGNKYIVRGRFTKLDQAKHIEFTWLWDDEQMAAMGETTVSYSISPMDGGSELTLVHSGFPIADAAKGHTTGWNGGLWRLERLFGKSWLAESSITLALNRKMYENALKGITEDELKQRPSKESNHFLWIAGHLASSRAFLAVLMGNPIEDEMSVFGKALDESADYPGVEEITAFYKKATGKIIEVLPLLSEAQLQGPAPYNFPINDSTLLGTITFMVQHEAYHIGQLGLLRKILGHEAVSYA